MTFPPRPREAGHESSPHRIKRRCHDDGDRGSRVLRSFGSRRPPRHDYIDLETGQLRGEGGERSNPPFRKSVLNGNVLALHVAQLTQPVPKSLNIRGGDGRRGAQEHTYPSGFRRLLRVGNERCGTSTDKPCQEGSAAHGTSTERTDVTPGL